MSPAKLSQPDHETIELLFQKCLMQLDLPPDKLKILREYPVEKKWEIIRDQDLVNEKHSPSYYVHLLRLSTNVTVSKFTGFRWKGTKERSNSLTGLEISLRTNSINWVNVFLSSECDGLNALVDYLKMCLDVMIDCDITQDVRRDSKDISKRISTHCKKNGFDSIENEIRLCIMCIKSIMNNQNGFNLVLQHPYALNCITNCLCHKNRRTKSLILDLLAAVCLVEQGHDLVICALDNFRASFGEKKRFESIVNDFKCTDHFDIDFMVSCIQFMNIVVHSVRNMDYRVALQYELASLDLGAGLTKLQMQYSDAEQLQIQVQAYLDNCINVGQLLDDSDAKMDDVNKIAELEEKLSVAYEKMNEMQMDQIEQMACVKRQLHEVRRKADCLQMEKNEVVTSLDVLRKNNSERSSTCSYDYQVPSINDCPLREVPTNETYDSCSSIYSTMTGNYAQLPEKNELLEQHCVPPMCPPPPPPPPPPPFLNVPNFGNSDKITSMTIKKSIETKYKLPCLNWIVLKPQQVKGTIFCDLNDKYPKDIDFDQFEELFKTGSGLPVHQPSVISPQFKKKIKLPASQSLLDGQRQRNLAIARRKLNMTSTAIVRAINLLDLEMLNCENVEILQHFVPTEAEIRDFNSFISDGKDLKLLSREDQFLFSLIKVERLSQKLAVMNFIGNFNEVKCSISPQLKVVLNASVAIRKSDKMKRLLEIILAFGNYMNSSKRGPVYGFKLQSLDSLLDIRSHDKKMTLLHFIVFTIAKNFPDLLTFPLELKYLEKASSVSLENVHSDVQELVKGLEIVKKEFNIRQEIRNFEGPPIGSFLEENESEIQSLAQNAKQTQNEFSNCVQYFGESPKTQTPSTFFSSFLKFQKAFEQAQLDLKDKFKIETKDETETKLKENQLEDKRILRRMDVTEGTIESLLDDLKRAPYVRADAVRRNRRKTREIIR